MPAFPWDGREGRGSSSQAQGLHGGAGQGARWGLWTPIGHAPLGLVTPQALIGQVPLGLKGPSVPNWARKVEERSLLVPDWSAALGYHWVQGP